MGSLGSETEPKSGGCIGCGVPQQPERCQANNNVSANQEPPQRARSDSQETRIGTTPSNFLELEEHEQRTVLTTLRARLLSALATNCNSNSPRSGHATDLGSVVD